MHTLALTVATLLAQANQPPAGDETNFVLWGIVLITVAVGLFVIEIFVPSGGILGMASAAALVGGVICLFLDSATLGLVGATIALIALPFAVGFAIKIWPNTPIGRALILHSPDNPRYARDDDDDDDEGLPPHPAARGVAGIQAGTEGRAITALRPVGTCMLNGQREECLAVGGTISPGTPVRVVAVDGMTVKVRAADA